MITSTIESLLTALEYQITSKKNSYRMPFSFEIRENSMSFKWYVVNHCLTIDRFIEPVWMIKEKEAKWLFRRKCQWAIYAFRRNCTSYKGRRHREQPLQQQPRLKRQPVTASNQATRPTTKIPHTPYPAIKSTKYYFQLFFFCFCFVLFCFVLFSRLT